MRPRTDTREDRASDGPEHKALIAHLREAQERLVDQSIEIAKDNGYAPFTTTIRAAWVEAIHSVTECLAGYLSAEAASAAGPIATLDYRSDPRFRDMRRIARQHRSLGITLQMYVGLFKHFRNLYLAVLDDGPARSYGLRVRLRDFFDEAELSIAADWTHSSDDQRIRELQERARSVTLDKDRYFAVFESLRNPAFLLDRSQRLVNANQAAAELFLGDAQAGEIIYLRSMRRRKSSLQDVVDTILDGNADGGDAVWLETLSGKRCFDIRMRALHDAVENTTLGHVVLLNDVTTYRSATDKAQQAEQAMSRFLATMSHEIRTPLHSVLGAAELMRSADGTRGESYLNIVESAGHTLLQTLNNVLDYSKFENTPPTPRPVPVDLTSALTEFDRVASVWGRQHPVPLNLELAENLPEAVRLDWAMAQQVLSNLVANAIRHDDGRGVCVAVSAPHVDGQRRLRFEVSDHGPGLPDAEASAMSHPFARVTPRDTGNGGAGLGLAIAHHLVDAMNGEIGHRPLDPGTLLWFELPCDEVAAVRSVAVSSRPVADSLSAKGKRCLIIDDDPISNIVTTDQLAGIGLEIDRATTLAQARWQVEANNYDFFIVDYILPDGTGPDFVRWMRRHAARRGRIVALTANAEAIRSASEEAGLFDAILSKPVDRMTLQASLHATKELPARRSHRGQSPHIGELPAETLAMMRAAFATSWAEFRDQLRLARQVGEVGGLSDIAHRLAGSAGILGITELEAELREIERHCRSDDALPAVQKRIAMLDRALETFPSWMNNEAMEARR